MQMQNRTSPVNVAMVLGTLWFLPFVVMLATYVMAPGYIVPFLNHPIGRIALIVAAIFHTLIWGLFTMSQALRWHIALRITGGIVAACSVLVMLVVPMLGPAVITIMQALGPVTGGS